MGGKGRRRREKNYLAAHGGNNRLPPPPNAKEFDALPSKLRKIIEFKNSSAAKKGDAISSAETGQGKRKRKRKGNSVKDLRFEALDQLAKHSKRKERKKEYLKERKNKHKKLKAGDALDFPGQENIRFGEVVEAPPKLSLPKVSKSSTMDASKERQRLQAVELYRKCRGWESRPGIKLPS